jgi:hypothetical protein
LKDWQDPLALKVARTQRKTEDIKAKRPSVPRKKNPVGCCWLGTGGTFSFIGNLRRKTHQPEERSLGVVALVGDSHYQH